MNETKDTTVDRSNKALQKYDVFLIVEFDGIKADSREQAYQFAKTKLVTSDSLDIVGQRMTLVKE